MDDPASSFLLFLQNTESVASITLNEALLYILLIFFIVALNAFFVASEFALVSVRRTRIQKLADKGSRRGDRRPSAARQSDAVYFGRSAWRDACIACSGLDRRTDDRRNFVSGGRRSPAAARRRILLMESPLLSPFRSSLSCTSFWANWCQRCSHSSGPRNLR